MGVQSLSRALAGRLFGVRETQGFSPARAQRFVKQLTNHRRILHLTSRFHDRPYLIDLVHVHVLCGEFSNVELPLSSSSITRRSQVLLHIIE